MKRKKEERRGKKEEIKKGREEDNLTELEFIGDIKRKSLDKFCEHSLCERISNKKGR